MEELGAYRRLIDISTSSITVSIVQGAHPSEDLSSGSSDDATFITNWHFSQRQLAKCEAKVWKIVVRERLSVFLSRGPARSTAQTS